MSGIDLMALGILAFIAGCVFLYAVSGILKNIGNMNWFSLILFGLVVLVLFRWCTA